MSDKRLQEKIKATILFVDDEKNILSSLKRLFRPVIDKIFIAESGAKGLEILNEESVDIIVSDMRMPEMDGAEFLEKVTEQWPDTVRILLTGYADITSTINAVNKGNIYRYVSKPWEDNDLKITIKQAMETKFLEQERLRLQKLSEKQNEELKELNQNLEEKVEQRTEQLRQTMTELESTHANLKKSYISTVKVFSNLIELREGTVAGYSRKVAEQSTKIAKKLGMNAEETEHVLVAGLLMDIGLIGLPDKLIQKPYGELSGDEKTRYHKHPIMGEASLMALEPLNEAAKLIRSHHENFDGRGYPDRIKADAIPLGSRILSLVSDYQSLLNGTFSKTPVTTKQILDYIKVNRKKRYDPEVVDIFFTLLSQEDLAAKDDFITVMTGGLEEGMVLARDIINQDGILLLATGQALSDNLIERIRKFEISLDEDIVVYVKSN